MHPCGDSVQRRLRWNPLAIHAGATAPCPCGVPASGLPTPGLSSKPQARRFHRKCI
ncbi:hypothetical protein X744_31145 [Mesorhizobium sp. LNJC372A00]|nr:hypothetical protein X763_25880 [Mesorhizobium sp. LSHC432A00]ESY51423.1 hypothetical protein X744_31145 [Mesorhizobium sp. LNJC372A00]